MIQLIFIAPFFCPNNHDFIPELLLLWWRLLSWKATTLYSTVCDNNHPQEKIQISFHWICNDQLTSWSFPDFPFLSSCLWKSCHISAGLFQKMGNSLGTFCTQQWLCQSQATILQELTCRWCPDGWWRGQHFDLGKHLKYPFLWPCKTD